ncbi:UNKNOWN [Stylonychia lemnae]|uniref:Uncharacterized protein n=1 Tax=Stylonychia lemnae TaxID=5949 RepID=A0A077ZX72_STYLE|nr:UNKNOWN [Stylonychia lemnae]|eukprot:CDW74171.1 UNKNOWN [Stylonychia lemnae]
MDYTIPFLGALGKYLVSGTDQNMQEIKEQICAPDNRLIEKMFTIIKKSTRVVFREDYENSKAFNQNPSLYDQRLTPSMPEETSYGYEDANGNRYFNDIGPMYSYEDLERMHDDPNYNIRLEEYKQRVEDRKNGVPIREYDNARDKEIPGKMLSAVDTSRAQSFQIQQPVIQMDDRPKQLQKYGIVPGTSEKHGGQERVDVDTRLRYLLQYPPKDSVILSRQYNLDQIDQARKQQSHTNAKVNMKNLTKAQKLTVGPRFTFPNFVNEYEAYFNPIHSYVDENGQVMQIDMNGDHIPRGFCYKPGAIILKMTNQMRYIYVLALMILKKCSQLFKHEVQKKAIFLETQLNGKKTTNSLLHTLVFIVQKAEFERTVFPDFLNEILTIEGDVNSQTAEIMSYLLEHPSIVQSLMMNNDFSFQVLASIKNNGDEQKNQIQFSLFALDILNQLVFSKVYIHPYYAEMIILDILERYYYEQIPIEIFVSLNMTLAKLAVSPFYRGRITRMIFKIITTPVDDGSATPAKPSPKGKSSKASPAATKASPAGKNTPSKSVKLSKNKIKEMKTAFIIDEEKLDQYLKKLYKNVKYLYSYSGLTKQLFNDIKNNSPYIQNTEEQFERSLEIVELIKKGYYDQCFNEMDIDNGPNGPLQIMDQFKEAVNGLEIFIFNDKSGLLKSSELVKAQDVESMFLKYAFEDSLKLIILKQINTENQERKQIQQNLLILSNSQSRLIDQSLCSLCKQMRNLANDNFEQMIKFYFQKFIQISFVSEGKSLQSIQQESQDAMTFDRNKVLEIKHIGLFQTILSFLILTGMGINHDKTKEELEQDEDVNLELKLIVELIQTTICGQNENLHTMDFLCFSIMVHKIFQTHIHGEKANDMFLEFFISRNISQIAHSTFDIVLQSLKNPKTTSFALNLIAADQNNVQCVIQSSKKGKVKVAQNIKKEMPSNDLYLIDRIAIHAANHYSLVFIHILNNSQKKYLMLMQKNVHTIMEQTQLLLSFYAQATKIDQSLKMIMKRLVKSIVTLYFAIYEKFFIEYESFFATLDIVKVTEVVQVQKDFKSIKLANQIQKMLLNILNMKEDKLKGNKNYLALFKILLENGSNFIMQDVHRELKKQCKDYLAFFNSKLTGDELKAFKDQQVNIILWSKLSFFQYYFQNLSWFLTSDDADTFYKLINVEIAKNVCISIGEMMRSYLEILQNTINNVDEDLQQVYQSFIENLILFQCLMLEIPGYTQFLGEQEIFTFTLRSIKQIQSIGEKYQFSCTGLIVKVIQSITDINGFLNKNTEIGWVLQFLMESGQRIFEHLQFITTTVRILASGCTKDKLYLFRPLGEYLREVLDQEFFEDVKSHLTQEQIQINQQDKESLVDEVKFVLSLLKPADLSEIKDTNNKIISNKGSVIQAAGLMSLSTIDQLKNYDSRNRFNSSVTSSAGFQLPEYNRVNMVEKVDDEFQKIMEKYTPQNQLDWLAIAKQSQKLKPPRQTPTQQSLRKTQSVAQFYFFQGKFNNY